jgi:Rps23 Pro-64 3,4-dihydroxylase Tpa1-like proline 4-hydroxylase
MVQPKLTDPGTLRVFREPFRYFTANAILDQDSISSLLGWFEADASWRLVETDFYEQHELELGRDGPKRPLDFLTNRSFLEKVRKEAGGLFGESFSERVEWTVHKLLPGQRIRIHNDLLDGGETHRVILHMNRGWSISKGGFLMFFNSPDPADVHRVLMPLNGSLVGFEISEKSSHAVSLVLDGERFAIVYSLYANNRHGH